MGALIRALGTTSPAAIEHKLEVDTQFRALVVTALGPDRGLDAEGIARVIGHVWSSALSRWVSGIAPDESVQAELTHAAECSSGLRPGVIIASWSPATG